jgi:hypothetical protein
VLLWGGLTLKASSVWDLQETSAERVEVECTYYKNVIWYISVPVTFIHCLYIPIVANKNLVFPPRLAVN